MNVQIDIKGADAQGRVFLTWTSVQATAKIVEGTGAGADIVLRSAGTVGGLVFDTARSDQGAASLGLSLPGNGQPVPFWIAGEFQKPSSAYGDAIVQANDKTTGAVLGTKAVMVRIRKNAQTLPAPERDRFLAALGTLNAHGQGTYRNFRDMHVNATTREMHGNVGFLPWHRAYVLDLERALQAFDPTVAVPYWRFDQPAPNLFTRDFMGASTLQNPAVVFRPGTPSNSGSPMASWALRVDRNLASIARPMSSMKYRRCDLAATTPDFLTWREILTATRTPVFRDKAQSALLERPYAIRCSSCCTPMLTGCGLSGSGSNIGPT